MHGPQQLKFAIYKDWKVYIVIISAIQSKMALFLGLSCELAYVQFLALSAIV